jgi:hypothetical protein
MMSQVPEFQGTSTYPASGPALILTTGYTTTIPFDCKDMSRAPYVLYEYEEDQGTLLQAFGDPLRKLVDANGNLAGPETNTSKAQGLYTRRQEFSLTAMPRVNTQSRWTYSRYWLATSMYEYVKNQAKREALYQQYSDGLKIHLVNGKIVKLESENHADVWAAIIPEPSDAVYHDPMAWSILGQQDLKNDATNIGVAYLERGLPTHIVDVDVLDPDQINSQPYMPNEVVGAKPGAGARLDSAVKTLGHTPFPEDLVPFIAGVDSQVQNNTGLLPPVYGGGERQPTAEGQRTVLNQALMQLGVAGEYAGYGWADVLTKAVRQIAKHAPRSFAVSIPGKGSNPATSEMLDLEALRNGKWKLEPQPGVPMSWAERQQAIEGIIKENPAVAHAMGLDLPINAPVVRDYMLPGLQELRVPNEDLRDKVIRVIIPELLQGQPIIGPDGQPQPSVMPEEFVDDPGQCAELAHEWLNSPPALKMRNTPGYANVVAWGMAQAAKVQPPPPEIKPSMSVAVKPEMYPPDVQSQILGKLGVQVSPQQLTPPPMPGPPMGAPGAPAPEAGPDQPEAAGPDMPPPPEQVPQPSNMVQ